MVFARSYDIITIREYLTNSGEMQKGEKMDEMDHSEVLVNETEQKMIMKIYIMAEQCKDIEELKEKLKALMK